MIAVTLLGGLFFLVLGGEALVRGAAAMGRNFGFSPLLIGTVIMGFGTSMPELVVSVDATLAGAPAIAAGNVVGSNIANVLLILGVAAVIRPIGRPPRFFWQDSAVLLGVSVSILLLGLESRVPAWQGGLMVAALAVIIAIQIRRDRRVGATLDLAESPPLALPAELPRRPLVALLLVAAGLGGLRWGAHWFVEGAVALAEALGVSKAVIGLTVVALGTSLPELAASSIAALRGHADLAYGNVIGSNLFNVLGILGCAAIAGPLSVPRSMALLDGSIMLAATVLMLAFIATGARINRFEGALMVAAYCAYIAFHYAAG